MPVAIISDIHGNLIALDAVLDDIAARQIQQIICLGDVAATGPQPREVIARLKQIACPVVMGNTDDWLLEPKLKEHTDPERQRIQEIEFWAFEQLSSEDRTYLAGFQPTILYKLENSQHLLAYHGSPRSYSEHISPTTLDSDLDAALSGHQADIFIGGHSHMQMFRRHRRSLVLNPGSVGLAFNHTWPFDKTTRNPPWAEYAIIDTLNGGLNIELHRVPFDVQTFIQITLASGMPHARWSAGEWVSSNF
ncbi:MAG TPA: metallophosphoesterase family protein [Ktedonobacteraceae bacterium]|nr:metallophosphoesterase family protein [Ktedonobacteraceae bacterium]